MWASPLARATSCGSAALPESPTPSASTGALALSGGLSLCALPAAATTEGSGVRAQATPGEPGEPWHPPVSESLLVPAGLLAGAGVKTGQNWVCYLMPSMLTKNRNSRAKLEGSKELVNICGRMAE